MSEQEIVLEILEHHAAPAPELPSHLFPGAGYDSGRFRVISGPRSPGEIKTALESRIVNPVGLTDFEPITGEGSFFVVDGEAPPAGTIIRCRLEQLTSQALLCPRDRARRILAQYFVLQTTAMRHPTTFAEAGWTLDRSFHCPIEQVFDIERGSAELRAGM
jgi:hypothetical protein